MTPLRKMVRRSLMPMDALHDDLYHPADYMARRPFKTGSFVLLGLVAFAVIYMFPELQRYFRMKRM
jgi:hypothetical protein